jgi:hypothetical protein
MLHDRLAVLLLLVKKTSRPSVSEEASGCCHNVTPQFGLKCRHYNPEETIALSIPIVLYYMGSSKNILNTTLKKMGRRRKMNVFSVLITVMLLACSSLDVSW